MDSTNTLPATAADALARLRSELTGSVTLPGGPDDDLAGAAAVVAVATRDDAVAAVRLARAHHLRVAVHSPGRGLAPRDGALVVDVGALRSVRVDPAAATATVEPGATWGDVLAASLPHGLAPVAGEWSHRAAVSDTLAGGMGWLARRHGLASDRVVRYELITPDGLVVDVTPDYQQELFWALGGAGDGVLGVVTEIEVELHQAGPLSAGSLTYPRSDASDVLARWREWTARARPELTTSVVVTHDAVAVHGCWAGSAEGAEQLLAWWTGWRPPARADWHLRPPGVLDEVNPPALAPEAPAASAMTSEWANTLRDELLDELLALAPPSGGVGVLEVRLLGGAARARSAAAANGYARRDQYLMTLAGIERPDVRARLTPWVTGATYLDRSDPTERAARVRDAFGDSEWERLAVVKRALDPRARFSPIT